MEFKIDMSKVAKVIVNKDEDNFMEYNIEDGTITDVRIFPKITNPIDALNQAINTVENNEEALKSIEELKESLSKIKGLIDNAVINKTKESKEYKKVDDIMRLVKDGTLDKYVKGRAATVNLDDEDKIVTFDDIKENIKKEPLNFGLIDDIKTAKEDAKIDEVKDGAKAIMELDKKGVLDEIAADNRKAISEKIFDTPKEEKETADIAEDINESLNAAAKINDRQARINFLKTMIKDSNKNKWMKK